MQDRIGKSHRLRKPTPESRSSDQIVPPWPSYKGISQPVGKSLGGRVTVYADPSLGGPGLQNARDLLADAGRIAERNDAIFGTAGETVSVIVFALDGQTDGSGGADHMGCDYVTGAAIEVCASFGNSMRVSALFEAELSECSMGGNLCSVSTGEALSRWCAADVSNNALSDFATAPLWARDGMQNYVDHTAPTDRDPISVGCGMAFLSWLISLGHPLNAIAPAMVLRGDSGTLADLYQHLTKDAANHAWPKFSAATRALPSITSDDPFRESSRAENVA